MGIEIPKSLLDQLADKSSNIVILTPNQRLAAAINRSVGEQCQPGYTWVTPPVFALPHWINQCWETLQQTGADDTNKALLPPWQEEALWEQSIENSDLSPLLRPRSMAKPAMEASKNLTLWQLGGSDLSPYLNHNALSDTNSHTGCGSFITWEKALRARLNQLNVIRPVEVHQRVHRAFLQAELQALSTIYLYGFDDISPLHQAIIESASPQVITLETLINEVSADNANTLSPKQLLSPCIDTNQEYQAAADWALETLKTQPKAKIGIICTRMATDRATLERALCETFEPHYKLPQTARYSPPFNFSAGTPLGTAPLVADALLCLDLMLPKLEVANYCQWLHSPFWGEAEEQNNYLDRVNIENLLLKQQRYELRSAEFRYYCDQVAPELGRQLQQLEDRRRHHPNTALPSHWAEFFLEQLELLQWPGNRALDSVEYQHLQQWQNLLEQFASGNLSQLNYTLPQALSALKKLAMSTHFQAELPETPISVLGPLEAAGLSFTHLWVTGLNAHLWPTAAAPNPLLPVELQREHQMPHASADRELIYAKHLLAQYTQNSSTLIYSWAMSEGDQELAPSALIPSDLPLLTTKTNFSDSGTEISKSTSQSSSTNPLLELKDDRQGPPVKANEPINGGAGLLKNQAINPFNCFAIHRLGAQPPREPVSFLSAAQRGELLHRCYEIFWHTTRSHQQLQSMTVEERESTCVSAIEQALKESKAKKVDIYTPSFINIESKRLLKLMQQWLEEELTRAPFEVVAIEERTSLQLNHLTLNLRIDRIDRNQDGSYWFIDYKTGSPFSTDKTLTDSRLLEPQLPLYTQASTGTAAGDCTGIVYGFIGAKKQAWRGIVETNFTHINGITLPDKINPEWSWTSLCERWRNQLGELANEFTEGLAINYYFHPSQADYYQSLDTLNRRFEQDQIREYLGSFNANTTPQGEDL